MIKISNYVYEDPLDKGYKQFKLTKKQHNELFKYRQLKRHNQYEYYYNEHNIILHKFYNWQGVLICTILFPVSILFAGLSRFKECVDELKQLYNQKKYGVFSCDSVSSGTETYDKVMKIIGG